MTDVLREAHIPCIGSDLAQGVDFLRQGSLPPLADPIDAIITNPPYELAVEFVEHALRLMEPVGGLVAMLLRVDWDSARTRSHLFADCSAWGKKVVLTRRIVWFDPAPGEKGKSPSENHAWFIWDWQHEGPPTIAYAPSSGA